MILSAGTIFSSLVSGSLLNATALCYSTLFRERERHLGISLLSHTAYGVTVVAVIVILRIDIASIHVEVMHIVIIVTRRRPKVAVGTPIVH